METDKITGNPLLQYLATASGTLAIVSDGMHYGWPSPSLPQLVNSTNHTSSISISSEAGSWMAVIPLIGSVVGALTAASIVDRLGRKKTIIATSVPFFLAWMLIAFASSAIELNVARFTAGAAGGVTFTAVPMYVVEISDPKVRGLLGSSCSVTWIIGILLINIIGSYLSIFWTAIVSSFIPLIACVTFVWMPESPYYLLMRDREADAKESLRKFHKVQDVDDEILRIKESLETQKKRRQR
ncbi:unnamed protein product [Brassicogethes aeneus]|uniref:Major facilitator superfamily (MFS) profile domain-containing protein n=1 Tax=Brassicogethes aeneus TaxID=1431903 RepID=A0A9P0ALG0_BRAAE|nr:unnamed protein product [Brassicogethes aeneus]